MTDPRFAEPAPTPSAASAWEDVLDIFYSPREVFERRRDGSYWVALLVLAGLTLVVYFLSIQMSDAIGDVEFKRAMARQTQKLTPEQIAQGRAFAEKIKGLLVYVLPVMVIIGAWISGLMTMLLGNMMGGKLTFAQGTAIAALSSMPELLGKAIVGAQGLFLDTSTVQHKYSFAVNAARFMSGDSSNWKLMFGALADPFVIWGAALLGLGAYIIGRMEKEKAAVLAVVHALITAVLIR